MLRFDSVSVNLKGRAALSGVSFSAARGALTVLAGPNGAGKTSALRAAAGLLPFSGAISIDGVPLSALSHAERARRLSYLGQGETAHWPMSVFDVVALGRLPHRASAVRIEPADEAVIWETLRRTGLEAFAARRVDALSQGERARVMTARALTARAPLLLADEPAAALDPYHQLRVLELLADEAARGAAVLVVLHNLSLAHQFANRVVLLADGKVAAYGATGDVLTDAALEAVYRIRAMGIVGESPFGTRWARADAQSQASPSLPGPPSSE